MIDVGRTIISQYGSDSTIAQLVRNMDSYIDPRADIDEFFDYVFNVETAQGFGLDILGRIVGVTRTIIISDSEFFGFDGSELRGFNQAPFFAGHVDGNAFTLTDPEFRRLILLKALSNISDSAAPSINRLLSNYFEGRGKCYVDDLGGMKIAYVFEFELLPFEVELIQNSGVMPRPAGVLASLITA